MPLFIKLNMGPGGSDAEISQEIQKVLQKKGESRKKLARVAAKASLQKLKAGATSGTMVPDGVPSEIDYKDIPDNVKTGLFASGRLEHDVDFILPEVIGSVDNLQLAPHKLYENSYDEIKSTLVNMYRALNGLKALFPDPIQAEKYFALADSLLLQLESVGQSKFDKAKNAYVAAFNNALSAGESATRAGGIAMKHAARTTPGYRKFHAMVWMNRKALNTKDIGLRIGAKTVQISPYNLGLMLERTVQAGLDVKAAYDKGAEAYRNAGFDSRESLIALNFHAKDVTSKDERYKASKFNKINHSDSAYGLDDPAIDTYEKVRAHLASLPDMPNLSVMLSMKVPSGFKDVTTNPASWSAKTKIVSNVSGLRLRKNPKNSAKHRSLSKGEAVILQLDSSGAVQDQVEKGITFYKVKDSKGNVGWVAYKSKAGKDYIKAQEINYKAINTM